MTRYELKDKERQAALEKALPGFTEALQNNCEAQFNDPTRFVNATIRICEGGFNDCIVSIQKDAILAKETYDPYKWNEYPNVTPPEKVWMRIEMLSQDGGIKTRDVAFYKAGRWCKFPLDNGEVILGRLRFRPWDEEDAK